MGELPAWLPAQLNLDGTWQSILERLYKIFCDDFRYHQTKHRDLPVFYDNRIIPDGQNKEEGFWHLTERKDRESGIRTYDPERSRRLPWARPIIESEARPEILVFDYDPQVKNKRIRRFIWLKDYDYLVILKKTKKDYILLTAYYIDSDGRRRYYQGLYEKRL